METSSPSLWTAGKRLALFLVLYPPVSLLWNGCMIIAGLILIGLFSVHLAACLVILSCDNSSRRHRTAVAITQRVEPLIGRWGGVMFGLFITAFGIPWLFPVVALGGLLSFPFLPMLLFINLMHLCYKFFPATSSQYRAAVVRSCRRLILTTRAVCAGCIEWTGAITSSFLPSSLWSAINNPTVDYCIFFTRQAKMCLLPSLAAGQLVAAITNVVLCYATSGPWIYLFYLWRAAALMIPAFVRKKIIEYHTTMASDFEEMGHQEWQEAHHSNSHIYEKLPLAGKAGTSGTVRLLTILPADNPEPLSCYLQVTQISEHQHAPVYEAISYVWGSDTPSLTITMNGLPFRITKSLLQLLLHLRCTTQTRRVWVDAICINQGDLSERASQVSFMGQIYSLAKQVVVWFGNSPPWGLDQAYHCIQAQPDASYIHYGAVRVATALLRNPWWTRIWVIQEVVLARRVIVYYGAYELLWEDLSRFLLEASRHPLFRFDRRFVHLEDFLAIERHYRQRKEHTHLHYTTNDSQRHTRSELAARGRNLLALMFDFRTRKATDPRDMVFALRGLSEEPELLQPNYILSPSDLVVEFAMAHIWHSRTLSILALVECVRQGRSRPTTEDAKMPSWCPFFTNHDAVRNGLDLTPLWTGLPGDQNFGPYSAAGHLAISGAFEPDDNSWSRGLAIQTFCHVRLRVASIGPAYNVSGSSLERDLFEVMTYTPRIKRDKSGDIRRSLLASLDKSMVFETWLDLAVESRRSLASSGIASNTVKIDGDASLHVDFHDTLTAGASVPSLGEVSTKTYEVLRDMACTRRKFFTTDCGSFGLGPEDAKEGDEVYVALGCQTPIVLRQEDSGDYSYVGQAYVKQLMVYKGDLAEDLRTGKVKTEYRVLE